MKFLLDTHVLLWLAATPEKIPSTVLAQLEPKHTEVMVSAVSAMEIATKTRLGKLGDSGLLGAWHALLGDMSLTERPLTASAALYAGSMSWEHQDPFDRMLAAQAIVDNLTLVTVDQAFRGLPAPRLLSW